jgi:sugar phosphate isomerase/epimerase
MTGSWRFIRSPTAVLIAGEIWMGQQLRVGVTAGFVFAHVRDRATFSDWVECIHKVGRMGFAGIGLEIFNEEQEQIFAGSNLLEIKKLLDEYDLEVGQFVAEYSFQNLFSLDQARRRKGIDQIKYAAEACLKLERPKVVEVTSYPPPEWRETGAQFFQGFPASVRLPDNASYSEFWKVGLESVSACLEHLHSVGLIFAIEPRPNAMFSTPDSILRFVEQFPAAARPTVVLDVGHLEAQRETIDVAFEKTADALIGVHLADHNATNYKDIPGTGSVDWQAVISGLKRINYTGPFDLEYFNDNLTDPVAAYAQGKAFVEAQLQLAADS